MLVAGLVVALLGAGVFLIIKRQATRGTEPPAPRAQGEAALAQVRDPSPIEKHVKGSATPPALPAEAGTDSLEGQAIAKPQKVEPARKAPAKPKVVKDPLAREALIFVGVDPDAEMYWYAAIHDPSLPASERQDLIDDLNEEGLPDPKHPTMDDLPLILIRLEILEELVPTISDGLEWKESYDDLLNLAEVATGGGKPVD